MIVEAGREVLRFRAGRQAGNRRNSIARCGLDGFFLGETSLVLLRPISELDEAHSDSRR